MHPKVYKLLLQARSCIKGIIRGEGLGPMRLEKLKAQQEAFQVHLSTEEHMTAVWGKFQEAWPALKAAIIQGFACHGLQATVTGGLYHRDGSSFFTNHINVKVPPSGASVSIEVCHQLSFDEDSLRSRFIGGGSGSPPTPMALPVQLRATIKFADSGIWWRDQSDNERLASIVVDLFKGKRGPDELRDKSCFVATVVFGEHSEEVAILRKWRDEHLSQSMVGRALINAYYGLGPFCATVVRGNTVARRFTRAVLLAVCHRLSRSI